MILAKIAPTKAVKKTDFGLKEAEITATTIAMQIAMQAAENRPQSEALPRNKISRRDSAFQQRLPLPPPAVKHCLGWSWQKD